MDTSYTPLYLWGQKSIGHRPLRSHLFLALIYLDAEIRYRLPSDVTIAQKAKHVLQATRVTPPPGMLNISKLSLVERNPPWPLLTFW